MPQPPASLLASSSPPSQGQEQPQLESQPSTHSQFLPSPPPSPYHSQSQSHSHSHSHLPSPSPSPHLQPSQSDSPNSPSQSYSQSQPESFSQSQSHSQSEQSHSQSHTESYSPSPTPPPHPDFYGLIRTMNPHCQPHARCTPSLCGGSAESPGPFPRRRHKRKRMAGVDEGESSSSAENEDEREGEYAVPARSPLEGRWTGPMPVRAFLREFGFGEVAVVGDDIEEDGEHEIEKDGESESESGHDSKRESRSESEREGEREEVQTWLPPDFFSGVPTFSPLVCGEGRTSSVSASTPTSENEQCVTTRLERERANEALLQERRSEAYAELIRLIEEAGLMPSLRMRDTSREDVAFEEMEVTVRVGGRDGDITGKEKEDAKCQEGHSLEDADTDGSPEDWGENIQLGRSPEARDSDAQGEHCITSSAELSAAGATTASTSTSTRFSPRPDPHNPYGNGGSARAKRPAAANTPTPHPNICNGNHDELGGVRRTYTYRVQRLPDISTFSRSGPDPCTANASLIGDHHAAQELLWLNTVDDAFSSTPPPPPHGTESEEEEEEDKEKEEAGHERRVLDDVRLLQHLVDAAVQRDRLTVVLNELLTASTHRHSSPRGPHPAALRTHVYLVLIADPWLRLVRADWGGVVVSERFAFRGDAEGVACLEAFLRGFGAMGRAGRGWDATVRVVPRGSDEEVWAKEALAPWAAPLERGCDPGRLMDEGEGESVDEEEEENGKAEGIGEGEDSGTPVGADVEGPPILAFTVPNRVYLDENWAEGDGGSPMTYEAHEVYAWFPLVHASRLTGAGAPQPTHRQVLSEAELDARSLYAPLYDWASVCIPSRNTLVYPVFHPQTGGVYLLKDSWRLRPSPHALRESEVLREMNARGVRNVPRLVCGEDVQLLFVEDGGRGFTEMARYHRTRADVCAGEAWNAFRTDWALGGSRREGHVFVHRVHHRFVEDFIGLHLEVFKGVDDARAMMGVVRDAVLAHQDAYEKCGIIHRDISANNIMATLDEGHGVLNDWDQARRVDYGTAENEPAAGTWRFQSARLLQDLQERRNEMSDDLESVLYVVLFHFLKKMALTGLRPQTGACADPHFYHRSTYADRSLPVVSKQVLDQWAEEFFDEYIVDPTTGRVTGGLSKWLFCCADEEWDYAAEDENRAVLALLERCKPLAEWVRWVREMLGSRYRCCLARDILYGDLAIDRDVRGRGSRHLLKDHSRFVDSLEDALRRDDWPECARVASEGEASTSVENMDDCGERQDVLEGERKDAGAEIGSAERVPRAFGRGGDYRVKVSRARDEGEGEVVLEERVVKRIKLAA